MKKNTVVEMLIMKAKESDGALDLFLNNLFSFLQSSGQTKILRDVLSALKSGKILSSNVITVSGAKHFSKEEISELETKNKELFLNKDVNVVEDKTLVGGYRIDTKNKRKDGSFKNQLFDLYSELIKATN